MVISVAAPRSNSARALYAHGLQAVVGLGLGGVRVKRTLETEGAGRHGTAAKVESPATNLNPNPRMQNGSAGYLKNWGSETSLTVVAGDGPIGQSSFLRVVTTSNNVGEGCIYGAGGQLSVASGVAHTASVYVRGSGTVRLRVGFDAGGGGVSGAAHALGGTWERLSVTATPGANTLARVLVETTTAQVATIETGAWQFEASPHPTAYLDGSMGVGFSWLGTADQSASQRQAGRISLPGQVASMVRGGIALWWRPDHAHDFTRDRVLFHLPTAGAPLQLRHVATTDKFRLASPGGDAVEVDAPSFAAGDDLLVSAGWTPDRLTVGAGEVAAQAARSLGSWMATGRMDLGSTGDATPSAGLHADGALGPVWWFDGPPAAEVLRVLARSSTLPRLVVA